MSKQDDLYKEYKDTECAFSLIKEGFRVMYTNTVEGITVHGVVNRDSTIGLLDTVRQLKIELGEIKIIKS